MLEENAVQTLPARVAALPLAREAAKPGPKTGRMLFIDNLRLLMIALVVVQHAAVTYSGLGSWYYVEHSRLDLISNLLFGVFQAMTQGYFMGLLFLIAGYFVPGAYDRKGFARFVKDRLIRLGIPALIYVFGVNPFIQYVLLGPLPGQPSPMFLKYYLDYLASGRILSGSGPLWFAIALLAFTVVYALARLVSRPALRPAAPSRVTAAMTVGLILIIAVGAFAIRLVLPVGTAIYNMQLCYFSSYIVLFAVGILAYRQQWLNKMPAAAGFGWLRAGLIGGPVSLVALMVAGGVFRQGLAAFNGGWHWQSAAYALWESFIAVSMSVGLIVLFREKCAGQSRLVKALSDSAFAVYVFHAPVLIGLSLLMRPLATIPLVKFLVAAGLALAASFGLAFLVLRRVPVLKEVL